MVAVDMAQKARQRRGSIRILSKIIHCEGLVHGCFAIYADFNRVLGVNYPEYEGTLDNHALASSLVCWYINQADGPSTIPLKVDIAMVVVAVARGNLNAHAHSPALHAHEVQGS